MAGDVLRSVQIEGVEDYTDRVGDDCVSVGTNRESENIDNQASQQREKECDP